MARQILMQGEAFSVAFFHIKITNETARLPCLLYRMQLTIDFGGRGKEVYTLVDKELEVVAK